MTTLGLEAQDLLTILGPDGTPDPSLDPQLSDEHVLKIYRTMVQVRAMCSGSGAVKCIVRPVTGWVNERERACRCSFRDISPPRPAPTTTRPPSRCTPRCWPNGAPAASWAASWWGPTAPARGLFLWKVCYADEGDAAGDQDRFRA